MPDFKKILLRIILLLLFLVSAINLWYKIIEFSNNSVQMDFTAYYTAGKSLNYGQSPYVNHIRENWNLWDGIATYKQSRFLYAPLVANMFQPVAKIPYHSAKYLWNLFNLVLFLSSLTVLIFLFGFHRNIEKLLVSLIISFNFFPFIAMLERGQIDGITLLLICLALLFLKRDKQFLSGFLFGLTVIFKFYSLLLIPFILLKKQYKMLAGYFSGIAVFVALTLSVSGIEATHEYISVEMPRIASFGESGTDDMLIPSQILRDYFPMTPTSVTIIEGRMYLSESISFTSRASLRSIIEVLFAKVGIKISNSVISVFIFIILFSVFVFFFYRNKAAAGYINDIIYWQIALLITLLSGPYTWIMNLVWLLPAVFILVQVFGLLFRSKRYFPIMLFLISVVLVSFPDNLLLYKHLPIVENIFRSRFIFAEIMLLLSLIYVKKMNRDY